ncbi:uncharacterized protein BDR25DRAFT_319893 [Lindgomyces ingoldianus]|uniref:Uncharacterized protein n=1 Tax=Lindgomyces ingoldianus TaxID=673940 RepID=A0ACB6Q9G3_9PLEO|nr:uncharacterized protein BDR25DRAFT_319893 [Lindgomyces ingoldianus]KAF2463515.1 hypothetical protein BDR25DRAFT_319893 [Lindgomyces ingoldianus]
MEVLMLENQADSPRQSSNSFNKQSALVNSGLTFRSSDAFNFNFNISSFVIPRRNQTLEKRSTRDVVRQLLTPPSHAFVHGVLSINWVVGTVGKEQFRPRESDERLVLKRSSELRLQGASLGLPGAYHGWLCGDDPDYTSTEESMILTPEFFKTEFARD